MKLRTFFGVLSPDLGFSRENLSLEALPAPTRAVLFVPSVEPGGGPLTIRTGETVVAGQALTAGPSPRLSPLSGTVQGVRELVWTNGESFSVLEMGVAGPASAPSSEEPRPSLPSAETVVVNGLESDLLVTVNRYALTQQLDALRAGVTALKAAGAEQVVLAVPTDLVQGVGAIPGAKVCGVPACHPNGHPEVLLRRLAKAVSLKGKVEVITAESLAAAATPEGPATKLVTFTGPGGVPERIFRIAVGTPVGDVLAAAGVTPADGSRILLGGPLTGRAAYDLDFPIMEDIDAVVVQTPEGISKVSGSPCINCGKCVEICPNRLPVNLIARYAEHSLFEKAEELDAERCIDCGLCAFVCTAHRPLVQYLQHARNAIRTRRAGEENES